MKIMQCYASKHCSNFIHAHMNLNLNSKYLSSQPKNKWIRRKLKVSAVGRRGQLIRPMCLENEYQLIKLLRQRPKSIHLVVPRLRSKLHAKVKCENYIPWSRRDAVNSIDSIVYATALWSMEDIDPYYFQILPRKSGKTRSENSNHVDNKPIHCSEKTHVQQMKIFGAEWIISYCHNWARSTRISTHGQTPHHIHYKLNREFHR